MPIIAPQHKWKDTEHLADLRDDWPEDCYVQWGGQGIVLGGDEGIRGTAFFEAMPKEGGFIRGEGATIREAEEDAHRAYVTQSQCSHLWGRGNYTNGGCICRRCGAFRSIMKPITKLGSWRDPISAFEIEIATTGAGLAPSPRDDAKQRRIDRRVWLRLRRAGFDLPEIPADVPEGRRLSLGPSLYAKACANVIYQRLHELGGPDEVCVETKGGPIGGFFDKLSARSLRWGYEEWLEEQQEPAEELSP